jgi:UDP-3-O-[3-hydroxymyristoyl] glucosamine N-acyltransferase
MKRIRQTLTLKQLSIQLDLPFSGNPDLKLTHACGLDQLQPGGLAYLASATGLSSVPIPRGIHRKQHHEDEISGDETAVIVPAGTNAEGRNFLFAHDPLVAHVRATALLHTKQYPEAHIHPTAIIGENVQLGENIWVGPQVVLYNGVRIGSGSVIHAGCVLMTDAALGKDCELFPKVVVQEDCIIGDRVILQSGVVIGADGHGYFQREGINQKIPQVGYVVIEDDVEIGANTTVDRARFTNTTIKSGSKIDNQVQIAHNVLVGEHSLISAQSAIGGSAIIGHHLILGGQTGIRDNVRVGNHVTAVARSVITSNIADKEVVGGMPSRPVSQWRKTQALIHRLEEFFDRLKKLESRSP